MKMFKMLPILLSICILFTYFQYDSFSAPTSEGASVAKETNQTQWEYLVAKFFNGQLTGTTFFDDDGSDNSYPKNAPSKISHIIPRVEGLASIRTQGWEIRVLQKVLDELGKEGWELICPIPEAGVFGKEVAFLFKKQILGSKDLKSQMQDNGYFDLDNPIDKFVFDSIPEFRKNFFEKLKLINSFKCTNTMVKLKSLNMENFESPTKKWLTALQKHSNFPADPSESDLRTFFFGGQPRSNIDMFFELDFSGLADGVSFRKSDLKKVFSGLKTDIKSFTRNQKISLCYCRFEIKCNFINELNGRQLIAETPDGESFEWLYRNSKKPYFQPLDDEAPEILKYLLND